MRAHSYSLHPAQNGSGDDATYFSCYRVSSTYITDEFVVGYDHGEEKFQHAILFIQNTNNLDDPNTEINTESSTDWDKYVITDVEFWVGSSPNWHENARCNEMTYLDPSGDAYYTDAHWTDEP